MLLPASYLGEWSSAPGSVSLANHSPVQVRVEVKPPLSRSPELTQAAERCSGPTVAGFPDVLWCFLCISRDSPFVGMAVTQEQEYFKEQIADGNRWC